MCRSVERADPEGSAPNAGAPARVQRGEPAAEPSAPAASSAPGVDPLEREVGLADRDHLGHAHACPARRASAARRPRRRTRRAARRGASSRTRAPVLERHPQASLIEPPADPPRPRRRRAGDRADRRSAQQPRRAARGRLDEVEDLLEAVRRRRSRGRARRGRRTDAGSNSRSSRTFARAVSVGATARRSRRFWRSAASSRSKSLEVLGADLPRARPRASIPRAARRPVARASGGSPTCQPPVPALSISISSSRPASRSSVPHHALGGRRAADVAHADKEQFHTSPKTSGGACGARSAGRRKLIAVR